MKRNYNLKISGNNDAVNNPTPIKKMAELQYRRSAGFVL
jgi:hypothetical protein